MPAHEVYLHINLLESIPRSGVQRQRILRFIQHLREHPNAPGDFTEKDDSLREYQVKVVGDLAVSYWLDAPARTVMVMKARKADR